MLRALGGKLSEETNMAAKEEDLRPTTSLRCVKIREGDAETNL